MGAGGLEEVPAWDDGAGVSGAETTFTSEVVLGRFLTEAELWVLEACCSVGRAPPPREDAQAALGPAGPVPEPGLRPRSASNGFSVFAAALPLRYRKFSSC